MIRAFALLIVVGAICGCTSTKPQLPSVPTASATSSSAPSTAGTGPSNGSTTAGVPSRIVYTVEQTAILKRHFDTIAEMADAPYTTAILRGTVRSTKDIYVEQVAYRVLTVELTRSYKQPIAGLVTVYEDGGLVPYELVRPELAEHGWTGGALPTAEPGDVVDFRFPDAPHTQTGDTVVMFVHPNPNPAELIPADWQLVSSVEGLLVEDPSSGVYVRRGISADASPTVDRSIQTARLDRLLGG